MTPLQPAFAAGELAPALYARVDLSKFHTGAAMLRNMFVHAQGGASNRAGTLYCGFAKYDLPKNTRLVPFRFNSTQTYILEFGDFYIRFIQNGGYILLSGVPYEIATPYRHEDVFGLTFSQSNDVVTITHTSYQQADLKRFGATNWTLTPISFATAMTAPTGVTATGTAASTTNIPSTAKYTYSYVVTAVSVNPADESLQSTAATVNNFMLEYYGANGVYNTVTWSAVVGASYYNVYRLYQGSYGFIGRTSALSLDDKNTLPDLSTTPPQANDPFAGGNWPGVSCYFQGRRAFAGSAANPQAVWMTRSGNITNMNVSTPTRADDAITATISATQDNLIHHMVPMQSLLALTSGGAFKISGSVNGNETVVTPSNISAVPQVFAGASPAVAPLLLGYDVLYPSDLGGAVLDMAYDFYIATFKSSDISILANHLFLGRRILSWAWSKEPFKVVWAVRDDGKMLGLTYLKEQEVYAWHQHDTAGSFLSVASVPETNAYGVQEDAVYVAVSRTLPSGTRTCIERMQTRQLGTNNDDVTKAWFLDCALQYSGTPVSRVTGLTHLAGMTVSILADGNVLPQGVVDVSGGLDLPAAYSTVLVGLPYTAQIKTLPLDPGGQMAISGHFKMINQVRLYVENTRGLKVGQVKRDGTVNLLEFKERQGEPWGSATALRTGQFFMNLNAHWDTVAQLMIQQDNPLPCTVLGVQPEVNVGGSG